MSGIPTEPVLTPLPVASRVERSRSVRLSSIIGTHFAIDWFSFVIISIMPVLAARDGLSTSQVAKLLAIGGISGGLVQPLIAWAGDRFGARWLGTLGFGIAVLAVSMLPHVRGFGQLLLLQLVAAGGIGAFHPIAAAGAGDLAGRRRARVVSMFFLAGMMGGMCGNVLSPQLVKHLGLDVLTVFLLPGLLCVALFGWAVRDAPVQRDTVVTYHRSLSRVQQRERWFGVGVLYVGNLIRFTVNMGLVYLLIQWAETHTLAQAGRETLDVALGKNAATLNGPLQGAMQLGMGAAGITAGWFLRTHHERLAMFIVPLIGAGAIMTIPFVGGDYAVAGVLVLAVVAGIGFGGMIPIAMAMAQRLLPHRTSLASGLMMGGGWAFAAIGPDAARLTERAFGLRSAFIIAGAVLALYSALVGPLLPARTDRERRSGERP